MTCTATKGSDMSTDSDITPTPASAEMYADLRKQRDDWPAIEAARVAAYWPHLSPRDERGNSVRGTDEHAEAIAEALVEKLGPNPVVRETPLDRYPGWTVREYADGMYDATHRGGALSPGYRSFAEAVAHARAEDGSKGGIA